MLVLLKLLQSLVRTLHSDGTPAQIAAGVALGAALGLTPLLSLHNLFVVAALALLNVSFGAGLLGLGVNLRETIGFYAPWLVLAPFVLGWKFGRREVLCVAASCAVWSRSTCSRKA